MKKILNNDIRKYLVLWQCRGHQIVQVVGVSLLGGTIKDSFRNSLWSLLRAVLWNVHFRVHIIVVSTIVEQEECLSVMSAENLFPTPTIWRST